MKDEKNTELMECPFCGSDDVYIHKNIGFDIYPTLVDKDVIEEHQHRDVCRKCDAWRFRFEAISMKNGRLPFTVGKWGKSDTDDWYMGF